MTPTPDVVKDLGWMVRRKRRSLFISVREAAKLADVSHSTLSRVENGGIPDLTTFAKLCEWLPADPAKLLGISNVMDNSAPRSPVN